MSVLGNVKDILATWWSSVAAPGEVAQTYLDDLDQLKELPAEDARQIIRELQAKLDRGAVPGDQSTIARLQSKLAQLYNEMLAQPLELDVAQPQELLPSELTPEQAESLVKKAESSLNYRMNQWRDDWIAKVTARFQREGSPFFAQGGFPQPTVARIRVEASASGLLTFIMLQTQELYRLIDNVRSRGADAVELDTIPQQISRIYDDYEAKQNKATATLTAFMDTYETYFSMQNVTNLINQYVIGKFVFGFIGKVLDKPITWLAKMTKTGRLTTEEIARAKKLAEVMTRMRHPFAWESYTKKADQLIAKTWGEVLQNGLPTPPPAPAYTQLSLFDDVAQGGMALLPEERIFIARRGALPEDYVNAIRKTFGGLGVTAIANEVSARLQGQVPQIIEQAVPGGMEQIAAAAQKAAEQGEAPEAAVDQWLESHRSELEDAVANAAAAAADELVEEHPIPTATNAAELQMMEREMWIDRVLSYYAGIGSARDYASLQHLFALLQGERGAAESNVDAQWIDGLIAAADHYMKIYAQEVGAVVRPEDEFSTPLELNTQ